MPCPCEITEYNGLKVGTKVMRVWPWPSGPHTITRLYTSVISIHPLVHLDNGTWEYADNIKEVKE